MQKEHDNILTPTMFQEQLRAAMGTRWKKPDEDVMEAETTTETATNTWSQIAETRAAYHVAISHAADMDSILAMRSANPSITEAELEGVREICEAAKSAVATQKGVYIKSLLAELNVAEAEAAKSQAKAAKSQAKAEAAGKAVEASKKLLDDLIKRNLDGAS